MKSKKLIHWPTLALIFSTVIILFVFLFFLFILIKFEISFAPDYINKNFKDKQTSQVEVCYDNDGGQNYVVKGTTCAAGGECSTDSCTSNGKLREYYCQEYEIASEIHTCNDLSGEICDNGRCYVSGECDILSADWSENLASPGQTVSLSASRLVGYDCEYGEVVFVVYQLSPEGDILLELFFDSFDEDGIARAEWIVPDSHSVISFSPANRVMLVLILIVFIFIIVLLSIIFLKSNYENKKKDFRMVIIMVLLILATFILALIFQNYNHIDLEPNETSQYYFTVFYLDIPEETVQSSILTVGSQYVVFEHNCDFRLSLQNKFATEEQQELLNDDCVNFNAIAVQSVTIECWNSDTIQDFISYSNEEIENSIRNWANDAERNISESSTDYFLLNCENPVHPSKWGTNSSWGDVNELNIEIQTEYLMAMKRRVDLFRHVFPNSKISLGPTIKPHWRGGYISSILDRIEGFQRAGELGVFDSVSCFEPRVFHTQGPDDPADENWMVNMTRQALNAASNNLTNSSGDHLPLCVTSSIIVINNESVNDVEPITPQLAQQQVEVVTEYDNVLLMNWWNGNFDYDVHPQLFANMELCNIWCPEM